MNSLALSSLRLVGRMGIARRVAQRSLAVPRVGLCFAQTRGFASKKTIDAVVSEKQRKQEFVRMLEEEANVLRSSLEESESSSVSTEVTDRFLKETGFQLEEDKTEGIIRLTKKLADKTVEVTFADSPEDYEQKYDDEEEGEEGEEGETEAEGKEEGEDTESEGTGEEREHSFTVEIKTDKNSFLFQCFAKNDGSFVVNKLTSGDRIPVQISFWSEDMQRELISFLDPLGINERLSYFIHQYLSRKETEENIQVLEDFRELVASK